MECYSGYTPRQVLAHTMGGEGEGWEDEDWGDLFNWSPPPDTQQAMREITRIVDLIYSEYVSEFIYPEAVKSVTAYADSAASRNQAAVKLLGVEAEANEAIESFYNMVKQEIESNGARFGSSEEYPLYKELVHIHSWRFGYPSEFRLFGYFHLMDHEIYGTVGVLEFGVAANPFQPSELKHSTPFEVSICDVLQWEAHECERDISESGYDAIDEYATFYIPLS